MLTKDHRLHAIGRPQGETQGDTQGSWPPRPSRRRRLLLRSRRKNKSLSELLSH
jgi:hypothetical protein